MRLIDADALKKEIHCEYSDDLEILDHIDAQLTINPEPHWIPVTERLPEAKQKVLVQYADGSMTTKRCNDAGHLQWFYANAVA